MGPWHHTATQILENIRSGNFTVEKYASSLLERIKERDDDVRAWAYLDPKAVLEQARKLDQTPKDQRGPLHGLPVGIKDIILTKGQHPKAFFRVRNQSLTSYQICRPNMVQLYIRTITP